MLLSSSIDYVLRVYTLGKSTNVPVLFGCSALWV